MENTEGGPGKIDFRLSNAFNNLKVIIIKSNVSGKSQNALIEKDMCGIVNVDQCFWNFSVDKNHLQPLV